MLVAQIKTDKRIYSLYSDNVEIENIQIYGHYFENNRFYPLNNEVFNEFNKLRLGKNYKIVGTYLEDGINYDIILDLDTNLKHYFNNGKESSKMFFNNFKPIIMTLSDEYKLRLKTWKIMTCALLVCNSLHFHVFHSPLFQSQNEITQITINQPASYNEVVEQLNETPELTIDNVKELINSNPNLSEYDKNIILNDDLLNFALPYINMNTEYKVELYNYILPNFKIEKEEISRTGIIGTRKYDVLIIDINKINNSNKNIEDYYKDTLIHEFAHMLQPINGYSFLFEGFTEMLANEFSDIENDPNNSYRENQKYIKILMEIIGTEPVTKYAFTGNIEYIKNELNKYLPEKQLNDLIECFKIKRDNGNFNRVETLLKEAFLNKYGKAMEDSYLMNKYLNTNFYNSINYLNNPPTLIPIIEQYTTPVTEFVMMQDENGNYRKEMRTMYKTKEFTIYVSRDDLFTCLSGEELHEQNLSYKSK